MPSHTYFPALQVECYREIARGPATFPTPPKMIFAFALSASAALSAPSAFQPPFLG